MLCTLVAVFLVVTQVLSVKAQRIELLTNAQRVDYIKSLKVTLLSDDYKIKTITIPTEFSKVYEDYNKLQLSANFDLRGYKGKEVEVYTYNCDGDRVVNLMICKGRLIGGDISETSLNGRMKALVVDESGIGTT